SASANGPPSKPSTSSGEGCGNGPSLSRELAGLIHISLYDSYPRNFILQFGVSRISATIVGEVHSPESLSAAWSAFSRETADCSASQLRRLQIWMTH
ncbi:MAG TPA: hypothetical protein VGE85_15745, partial [Terracidiphilus sp.]